MHQLEFQQSILDLLSSLRGLNPLKQLFWSELNYERENQPLSRRGWTDTASQVLAEDPVVLASGGNDFHVIYARSQSRRLLGGDERTVVNQLLKNHPYALFVFSNNEQDQWHFINVKIVGDKRQSDDNRNPQRRRLFRRITVAETECLRTASERIALLDLAHIPQASPLDIQLLHDQAFNVEAVTQQFFEEYKALFSILQDDLTRQTHDSHWAHDYALQFLNRLMFLYFIQRKGWLGNNREFLHRFWSTYQDSNQPINSFVDQWLNILFFDAFNNRFHGGYRHFPNEIQSILQQAPYLNGGLFRENELDRQYSFSITDRRFAQVLIFLERYNFTISEDTPLDQEVAVDPEMIGKVYESLVNVSNEADERGDAGIFYTPRIEIDLMCRLSLVDYLTNHLGVNYQDLLYEFILALEPEEKALADQKFAEAKLWDKLDNQLCHLTLLDPACGSGAFLVGFLSVLDDLQQRVNQQLNREESAYERKKRIIGQSLYGVDVMDWACRIAELRLWLALIIDAEIPAEELYIRREPLLPNFTFKVRPGDSLVQEVGGIDFRQIRSSIRIAPAIKGRITRLKTEKLKFYNNDQTCEFKSDREIRQEELRLFRDILDNCQHRIQEQIKSIHRKLEEPEHEQIPLLEGVSQVQSRKLKSQIAEWQNQLKLLSQELSQIKQARAALKPNSTVPFVWDIAFVEIFEGEQNGFDIVIGNPPYVRQENIANPFLDRDDITTDNKKDYKAKLARSVYQLFPKFFGYQPQKDINPSKPEKAVAHKLDSKSDLYIYFYFHGLSLLNYQGSFCFITWNSWLDVGYGSDLQEFLLRHCHVKIVLDNGAKRSFASADVNTVITLLSAPNENSDWGLNQIAKFVACYVPFEQVFSPTVFQDIEAQNQRQTTQEYRVYPIAQSHLLEEGWKYPENTDAKQKYSYGFSIGKYVGNKWGGKYLRAPDIYWVILERCKDKLVELGNIADVQFGIKTGANKFFYLDKSRIQEWEIEAEFLKPVILRPADIVTPQIQPVHLNVFLLVADKPRNQLRGTKVEQYIRWGESQGFDKTATCKARGRKQGEWYRLQAREPAPLVLPIINKMRLVLGLNESMAQVDHNCVEIRPHAEVEVNLTAALMLGTFNFIERHTEGRSYGCMLKVETYEAKRLLLQDPRKIAPADAKRLLDAFQNIRSQKFQWLIQEMETPEREAFDRAWLSVHGFHSAQEQTAALEVIYAAVRNLSNEMNAQEKDWVGNRPAVRQEGNPQDVMKGKRGTRLSPKEKSERHEKLEAARRLSGIWADLPEGWEDDDQ
ncbi:Eco57I restriction-modification methylase domain-containing protein [Coleofasciculus sp. E1-EBD-02]|uniref:Eco57I restriction-modification methylase domain-containing protein n=1 Tax=Coleofasciculus sp. E1-EBD-02 TaxID=3068481 RepID=UPI0032F4401D